MEIVCIKNSGIPNLYSNFIASNSCLQGVLSIQNQRLKKFKRLMLSFHQQADEFCCLKKWIQLAIIRLVNLDRNRNNVLSYCLLSWHSWKLKLLSSTEKINILNNRFRGATKKKSNSAHMLCASVHQNSVHSAHKM